MRHATEALRTHWPEYLIEAWALGTFMVAAGIAATLLEYPRSSLHQAIASADARRAIAGVAMGLTAIGLIYSPWGKRSGAHMNPAVTLTFLILGKVRAIDAVFYIAAQFMGGLLGVLLVKAIWGSPFSEPPVNFAATVPGVGGAGIAFIAEAAISGGLMFTVLTLSAWKRTAPLTGLAAGILVATYISLEGPLSGMSMNPARTFASAVPAHIFGHLWLYFTAPVLGMLAAASLCRGWRDHVTCAKLVHGARERCIHCGYEPTQTSLHAARMAASTEQGFVS